MAVRAPASSPKAELNRGGSLRWPAAELCQVSGEDSVTTAWHERSILLAGTDSSGMAVFDSFTTHVRIADDSGISAPLTAVPITGARTASRLCQRRLLHDFAVAVAVAAAAGDL